MTLLAGILLLLCMVELSGVQQKWIRFWQMQCDAILGLHSDSQNRGWIVLGQGE